MTKPSPDSPELLARPQAYRFGRCELRPEERVLLVDGEPASIGGRALDVLLALVELRGRVVSKDELLERVWRGLQVEENNLSTQVSLLRRLVGRDTIATVSGLGYRFTAVVESVDGHPTASDAAAADTQAPAATADDVLHFGRLEWRPGARAVVVDRQRADIGSRAIDLLAVLLSERHRVVPKRELLERVWPGMVVEENNLQVQVSALRKLLGQEAVATIPGRGYRFTMQPSGVEALPPPAAPPTIEARTNLPNVPQALIGRSDDLRQIEALLKAHRLVTLVGAGGIGKTRAAQALGRLQLTRFEHGVWWVGLGALASPGEVAPAIAAALRVQLTSGDAAEAVRQLALSLQSRNTLIVLDNCEHVIGEVAHIAAAVLDAAERVTLMATSQEPLRIEREQVFRLGGLEVPAAGASLEQARLCGALALLEQRAHATSARFALTEPMLPAAIQLCRQLDGIPLAIEMAAARLPQLGVAALQAALGERLEWLHSGLRNAPARQQTLRATLDWSWSLLGSPEQAVLRRLAVFSGNFRLDAAQRVASDVTPEPWAVADAMATLVERSLLQVDDNDPPRYRLLETVRLYAEEQLLAHRETERAKAAHMHLMAAIGDEAERAYWTRPDSPWLARYGPEYDDLHAAFVNACEAHDATAGAATLDALYRLDEARAMALPLSARLPAAHTLLAHADAAAALRIRLVLASLFVSRVPLEGMSRLEMAQQAVQLARSLGDTSALYRALMTSVLQATVAGEEAIATQALAEAQALEAPSWPARLKWFGAFHLVVRQALRGESRAAMASQQTVLACAEAAGSAIHAMGARAGVADLSLMCGDAEQAIRLGVKVVEEARALGQDPHLTTALINLCAAHVVTGNLTAAGHVAHEAVGLAWRFRRIGDLVDHVSFLAAKQGRVEDSLLLGGFADAWWAQAQYAREGNEAAASRGVLALGEEALGAAEAARLRKLGAQLDDAQARHLVQECIAAARALQRPA
jgi:predicted ATPase/DNA-binding winged helix-turn-helix (wHTH) protein